MHPYQLAYADPRVTEEVLGSDHDTWMASPYAPQGVAKPVDGGYIFNGRWQFSSGTDACDWIFLGAMLGDADGKPAHAAPDAAHDPAAQGLRNRRRFLECGRAEGYRLKGRHRRATPSFPAYRMMDATKVMDGTAQRKAGMTETLYLMPWSTMFPLGITSAAIGIAEGALAAHLDYQRDRVGAYGAIKDDPYVMHAIGEAAADINAARQELLANVDRIYDIVDAGKEVSFADRAAGRRTQVRSAWRAVWRSTRSSPARAATRCAWTSLCSGIGATHMPGLRMPSTCQGRRTTPPR